MMLRIRGISKKLLIFECSWCSFKKLLKLMAKTLKKLEHFSKALF